MITYTETTLVQKRDVKFRFNTGPRRYVFLLTLLMVEFGYALSVDRTRLIALKLSKFEVSVNYYFQSTFIVVSLKEHVVLLFPV